MINSDESTNGAPVNPLVTLSATEIESIEILKDASSAQFMVLEVVMVCFNYHKNW
jgi:hypothetical protein